MDYLATVRTIVNRHKTHARRIQALSAALDSTTTLLAAASFYVPQELSEKMSEQLQVNQRVMEDV